MAKPARPPTRVLLGIGGGIAAYKAAELARMVELSRQGMIDGAVGSYFSDHFTRQLKAASMVQDYLGLCPKPSKRIEGGGATGGLCFQSAWEAVSSGRMNVCLAFGFETMSRVNTWKGNEFIALASDTNFDFPVGGFYTGYYAMMVQRHMHEFGTTSEQLAEIAVSTRSWAAMNPSARYREPITVDDVLASPMIAAPLHKLDCCLVTDGAGALVMTKADRARDLRRDPIYVLGAGTSHTHAMSISQMPDLTVTAGAVSGPKAFAMAGITATDVDVLETYDSFTITVLLALEDLGFCAKGEGGAFVAGGRLGPGGELPTNTNGGGLSYTHPGMYGMFVLVEAVRQLRGGLADRQVPGAKVAVAHGCGGVLSSTSTVVLGTEETL